MEKNNEQITGGTLIIIMVGVCLVFILGMLYFEKYFKDKEQKMVISIFAILICLNIMIFLFLYLTFSKIRFREGPEGPKGIRGRRGLSGKYQGINLCHVQKPTLEQEKYEIQRRTNIRIQKPVLGN
jgi:hypothetical protein